MTGQPSDWDLLQDRGQQRIDAALARHNSICAVAPTGFGKSHMMRMRIDRGGRHIVYTHRRMLLDQLHQGMIDAGIVHGLRASGQRDWWRPHEDIQIAMLQTEESQVHKKKRRQYFKADVVHLDEGHCNKDDFTRSLMQHHIDDGAKVILYSATPVGLGGMVDELVEVARNSEARKCGSIIPFRSYSPSQPDITDVKKVEVNGEFSQKALAKKFHVQQVVGSIYEWWLKLNPLQLPAVGFTPGVEESMWFVDEFKRRGVPTASVDATSIYYGDRDSAGERIVVPSSPEERDRVFQMSLSGHLPIVWNRFVMREGVDWRHLYHCIMATAVATEEAFVQMAGRVARSYPGMDHCLLQDHGGNVARHGNPNDDRIWCLQDTNSSRAKERAAREESGVEQPPVTCPQCRRSVPQISWTKAGKKCPICNYGFTQSVKFVIETDGQLHRVPAGSKVKVQSPVDAGVKAWNNMYYAATKSKSARGSNFKQLRARFNKEFGSEFLIRQSHQSDHTVIEHRRTGEVSVLFTAPEWHSGDWGFRVRDVHAEREARKKEHHGEASNGGGAEPVQHQEHSGELGGLFAGQEAVAAPGDHHEGLGGLAEVSGEG